MPNERIVINGRELLLDARPDRLDLRDRTYTPRVACLPPRWPSDDDVGRFLKAYTASGRIRDQGQEGACTGFGLACVINYLLFRQALERCGWDMAKAGRQLPELVSERMLYHLARFYDEWPGEDYDGSSCRGALKGWHKHGVCGDAKWPYWSGSGRRRSNRFVAPAGDWDADAVGRPLGVYYRIDRNSVVDMMAAIYEVGAIYVSANVHQGWAVEAPGGRNLPSHDRLPLIQVRRGTGGHAFALVGYNERGFVVQNSWGEGWGHGGFAVLPYRDWIDNGTDAWVCALGVPTAAAAAPARGARGKAGAVEGAAPRSHAYYVRSRGATAALGAGSGLAGLVGEDDAGRGFNYDVVGRDLAPRDTRWGYEHALVADNDGMPVNRLVRCENARAAVETVAYQNVAAWMKQAKGNRRVVVYAHGGLNSEADSILRARVMGPYFEANGIYPIFVTWKTGFLETLRMMLQDRIKDFMAGGGADVAGDWWDGIRGRIKDWAAREREKLDRRIEVFFEETTGKPFWTQMKQNAAMAALDARALGLLAQHLARLQQDFKGTEIHLLGHSAGSLVLGHLLDKLAGRATAASCSLFAPACTVMFANAHYIPAIQNGTLPKRQLHVHLLADENELGDSVGPYGKSLLYLVSRAAEEVHKTPLLGLINAFSTDRAVRRREFFDDGGDGGASHYQAALDAWVENWKKFGGGFHVQSDRQMRIRCEQDGSGKLVPNTHRKGQATHGGFDNCIDHVELALARAVGVAGGDQLPRRVVNLDY